MTRDLERCVETIESRVANPTEGLPDSVFRLVTRLTPMVNVDLLIRNDRQDTLLTWRDDGFYHGWHVPGGIVRIKERMLDRIAAVARLELDAVVKAKPEPVAFNEIITERAVRGHFLSFLFDCDVLGSPAESLHYVSGAPVHGQWAWHARCPDDIIPSHGRIYRRFIGPPQ